MVLGILSGFLVMLIQFVSTGVDLFDEGETGQALADRAQAARSLVERELRRLSADGRWIEPGVPDDRLVVQDLPLGLPAHIVSGDPTGPVVRGGIQLEPMIEERMIQAALIQRAIQELGTDADPGEIDARAKELQVGATLRGRGRMLMLAWPQTDREAKVQAKEATLLELRLGRFLMDERLQVGDQLVDPFAVPDPGSNELPATVVHAATEVLVDNLLHFGIELWSQQTRRWDGVGTSGPLKVWDSARAGWIGDSDDDGGFPFELGEWSESDPSDDIHPHALRVTMVVAADESGPREGLLAAELGTEDRSLLLVSGERFPGPEEDGYCKVGGEWVGYRERSGDRLIGLSRGLRGTARTRHEPSSIVRVGRMVQFVVPVPHARDDWDHTDG